MKNITSIIGTILIPLSVSAQVHNPDTIIVELATSSKVTFTMQDRNDLEQLKEYDYQALFDDIFLQLKEKENSDMKVDTEPDETPHVVLNEDQDHPEMETDQEYADYNDDVVDNKHKWFPHTRHFFNLDLGMNNYLENGKFPDADNASYAVHPWGSWYVGLNTVHRTRFSKHFSLEGSLGISWYNFKFDENKTRMAKNEDGVVFLQDSFNLDIIKSKLTVSYLNASLIPMFNSTNRKKDEVCGHRRDSEFRIGAGPYIGYRLSSYSKQQFEIDGENKKNIDRDNFYLENIRYGLRLQVGIHALDFFFNYDMNNLFNEGKGPELNAYSFGVIF